MAALAPPECSRAGGLGRVAECGSGSPAGKSSLLFRLCRRRGAICAQRGATRCPVAGSTIPFALRFNQAPARDQRILSWQMRSTLMIALVHCALARDAAKACVAWTIPTRSHFRCLHILVLSLNRIHPHTGYTDALRCLIFLMTDSAAERPKVA